MRASGFTTGAYPPLFLGSVALIFFVFFVLSYYVSLRSEFLVVTFATISTYKRCSVHLVCRRSHVLYLRYIYQFAHSGGQHILCCVFCFVCLRLVPYVSDFYGLSIFDWYYLTFSYQTGLSYRRKISFTQRLCKVILEVSGICCELLTISRVLMTDVRSRPDDTHSKC